MLKASLFTPAGKEEQGHARCGHDLFPFLRSPRETVLENGFCSFLREMALWQGDGVRHVPDTLT